MANTLIRKKSLLKGLFSKDISVDEQLIRDSLRHYSTKAHLQFYHGALSDIEVEQAFKFDQSMK